MSDVIRFRRDPVDESLVISEGTQEVFRISAMDTMKLYAFLGYSLSRRYASPNGVEKLLQSADQVITAAVSSTRDVEARTNTRDERVPPRGGVHTSGGTASPSEVVGDDLGRDKPDVRNNGIFSSDPGEEGVAESRGTALHPFTPGWAYGAKTKSCNRCGKAREDKEAHGE